MTTGTIAYCTREDHCSPLFASFLAKLAQRHPNAKILPIITNDVAAGRNKAVLDSEGDWIWFIDTDQAFAATTLERLLAHNVDVVQVLCLKRHPPHQPIVWQFDPVEGNTSLTGPPRLVEVQSLGAGGTLYRRRVFEAITGPWFEGILGTEDTCFAQKIRAAGFALHVDLATPVGHTAPTIIWPEYQDGQWLVRYDAMNGQQLWIPFLDRGLIEQARLPEPALSGRRS